MNPYRITYYCGTDAYYEVTGIVQGERVIFAEIYDDDIARALATLYSIAID